MTQAFTTSSVGSRLVGIDVLRAVAVVLVIFRHNDLGWSTGLEPIDAILRRLWTGGWIGVDLFFVLSGFLVSSLLFREHLRHGRIQPGRFLIRRGLKIYPAFYVFLAATVFYEGLARGGWRALLHEAIFIQNYASPTLWGHTWTLAVEEHFYFLLALAFWLWGRKEAPMQTVQRLPSLILFASIFILLARTLAAEGERFDATAHLFPSHLRFDSFLVGVLLSYFHSFHHDAFHALCSKRCRLLGAAGLLMLLPAFFFQLGRYEWIHTYGLSIFAVGSALLICAALGRSWSTNRLWSWVASVGTYSYSIYLWHMPVRRWLMPRLARGDAVDDRLLTPIFVVASLAVGVILSRVIEIPVLHARDRYFPTRVRSLKA